LRERQASSQ
jgi:hypothetical protein